MIAATGETEIGSDTQERLRDPGDQATEFQRRVGGGETDAILADIGDGGMIQIFVGDFDVAGAEMIHLVAERALEHQSKLGALMTVIRYGGACGNIEKADRRIA